MILLAKLGLNVKKLLMIPLKRASAFFYLYGQDDAIYKLVKMSLIEYKRHAAIDYQYIDSFDAITNTKAYKILVWNKETLELKGDTLNVLIG